MDERHTAAARPARFTRRATLRLLGGVGAAALLGACGADGAATPAAGTAAPAAGASPTTRPPAAAPATAARSTAAPTGGGTPARGAAGAAVAAPAEIRIANTGATLPTDKVTFRWIDSGDQKAVFLKEFFQRYQQAHPNITIQYDPLPFTEIAKAVPLGVQSGNAHDVFQLPQNIPSAQAVKEGWVAPLDEIIPNFQEWKKAFPAGVFLDGVAVFNGKTYTIPLTSLQRYSTLTLYNTGYMQQAGYDPAAKPLTWDEFRAAAKKITEQGKGQYYGLIIEGNQTPRFANWVGFMAEMAGAGGYEINWKTGEYNYASDEWLAALDLLLAIKSDNSIFPGSLQINAPQARAQMANGVAGMILQGPQNIPIWQQENPGFKFGVASQPVPNSGTPTPIGYGPGGAFPLWVFAKSPHKAIAGDILHQLGTLEMQTAWAQIVGVADPPLFPEASKRARLDPLAQRALALYEEQMRLHPSPVVRNPDVAQVYLEQRALKPDTGQVIQGIFTGQLRDAKAAMQDLTGRAEQELERAIKEAQQKGAKVSRDDWKFPNWTPTEDYTEAKYREL